MKEIFNEFKNYLQVLGIVLMAAFLAVMALILVYGAIFMPGDFWPLTLTMLVLLSPLFFLAWISNGVEE